MKRSLRVIALFLFLSVGLSAYVSAQTTADDELKLGVQAYKHSRFVEAVGHFERCVALDPSNVTGHLYLGTAFAEQYIPGAETPDNTRFAEQAIAQYLQVLDGNPETTARISSTKAIAYLYLQMKKFDDAKKYYRLAADLDPNDPETYYSVGVIDWTLTYVPRQEKRARLDLKPDQALWTKDRMACFEMKEQNAANIQEAIENLNKAIQLRPDYDDAMAYMNLMYREKADAECDDLAARKKDLRTADEWVDKTMATKKAKAEKAAPTAEPSTNPQ